MYGTETKTIFQGFQLGSQVKSLYQGFWSLLMEHLNAFGLDAAEHK